MTELIEEVKENSVNEAKKFRHNENYTELSMLI